MRIEITLSNNRDALLLRDPPEGVSLVLPGIVFNKGFGYDVAVQLTATLAAGVPLTLLAKWLEVQLSHRHSKKITINRREVHFREGEIARVLEETRSVESQDDKPG
jgi:hypothetical protein